MAMKTVKRARRVTGIAIGAAAMYFFDPQLGAERRQTTKDKVAGWWQGLGQDRRRADTSQVVIGVDPIPPLERVASAS